jgi:lysophospholipase L1-like esterase
VSPGAGLLLTMLFTAGACLVGVWRGPDRLREQLAGWSLIVAMTGAGVLLAEAILRVDRVAAQIGTPIEIDTWWQRYDAIWERNVLAIRSPHETLRKEPGVVRIVALGDSFTWGDKIATSDSTWPAQLERDLRSAPGGREVEVINLGQKGYTTVNEAESLRRLGWQFDPDIVVVQFYLNDILPSGPNFERGYSGWIFPRSWILPERYKTGPAGRSALLHVVESVLSGRRHGDRVAQAARWTEVYQRRGPEWAALAGAIEEMGEAAAERNIPIVLMLFPDFIPGMSAADLPFGAIHDQVVEVARAAGYSILDLTPHFLRANPDMRHWWATPYDTHPNAAAAALAAERLSAHLMDVIEPGVWNGSGIPERHDP